VIQVNVPRPAVPVNDRDIDRSNDQSRLLRDPTFARLIRPSQAPTTKASGEIRRQRLDRARSAAATSATHQPPARARSKVARCAALAGTNRTHTSCSLAARASRPCRRLPCNARDARQTGARGQRRASMTERGLGTASAERPAAPRAALSRAGWRNGPRTALGIFGTPGRLGHGGARVPAFAIEGVRRPQPRGDRRTDDSARPAGCEFRARSLAR
jgi:hypothetical protein